MRIQEHKQANTHTKCIGFFSLRYKLIPNIFLDEPVYSPICLDVGRKRRGRCGLNLERGGGSQGKKRNQTFFFFFPKSSVMNPFVKREQDTDIECYSITRCAEVFTIRADVKGFVLKSSSHSYGESVTVM